MNPLLCTIAFCSKDAADAQKLLTWIEELGGCERHHCLLVVDSKVDGPTRVFIKMTAANSFASVEEIEFTEPPPPKILKWPLWRYFANQMWLKAAWHVSENCRLPWLWLEPDATPLSSGWLDAIADSYYSQPKLFHGPIILAAENRPTHWPAAHMAGVAVYPPRASYILEKFCDGEHTWDLGGGNTVVPKATKCRLVQHSYGPSEVDGWRFKIEDGKIVCDHPEQTVAIRDDAVLFHRCDDDSLIRCLRQLRNPENGFDEKNHVWQAKEWVEIDGAGRAVNFDGKESPQLIGSEKDFEEAAPVKRGPGRPRKILNPVGAH